MAVPATRAPKPQRGPWFWVGILGGIGLILLALVVVATLALKRYDESRALRWGGAGGSPGQTVRGTSWEVTVTGVERPGKTLVEGQPADLRTARGTWVVVAMRAKNTGDRPMLVKSNLFALHTAAGRTHGVASQTSGYTFAKGGQPLGAYVPSKTEVTYYLVFDVPPDATGLQFAFRQDDNPIFDLGDAAP